MKYGDETATARKWMAADLGRIFRIAGVLILLTSACSSDPAGGAGSDFDRLGSQSWRVVAVYDVEDGERSPRQGATDCSYSQALEQLGSVLAFDEPYVRYESPCAEANGNEIRYELGSGGQLKFLFSSGFTEHEIVAMDDSSMEIVEFGPDGVWAAVTYEAAPGEDPGNSCADARNGVCEESTSCTEGTDFSDCHGETAGTSGSAEGTTNGGSSTAGGSASDPSGASDNLGGACVESLGSGQYSCVYVRDDSECSGDYHYDTDCVEVQSEY